MPDRVSSGVGAECESFSFTFNVHKPSEHLHREYESFSFAFRFNVNKPSEHLQSKYESFSFAFNAHKPSEPDFLNANHSHYHLDSPNIHLKLSTG